MHANHHMYYSLLHTVYVTYRQMSLYSTQHLPHTLLLSVLPKIITHMIKIITHMIKIITQYNENHHVDQANLS
jgi:hypothetical protein